MDYETLDETEQVFPEEAVVEISSASRWMMFTGIFIIIFSVIIMMVVMKTPNEASILSFLGNCFSLYIGFLLIGKAVTFKSFSLSRDTEVLKKALGMNKKYWMLSTISIIVNVVISLTMEH
jgi:hypothetical protein